MYTQFAGKLALTKHAQVNTKENCTKVKKKKGARYLIDLHLANETKQYLTNDTRLKFFFFLNHSSVHPNVAGGKRLGYLLSDEKV